MRITADTNLLLRVVLGDDPKQRELAEQALANADLVAITTATFCEFVWVLERGYGIAAPDISLAIRTFLNTANVATNNSAVEAGLLIMDAGGDFADGAIAHEGLELGAETFLSFDKAAVRRLSASGSKARLLS